MAEICEAITLKVVVPLPIILTVDFRGEFLSSSDGEDYKRGYEEGHAQGLIDGQKDGYQSGYDEGYTVGSESGYQTGKQDGLTEGYDNGYAQGKADGYKDGYDEGYQIGYTEGYEKGKAEGDNYYDTFWDIFQQNGTRVRYAYAFANSDWTVETFRPKYDIKPTHSANYIFCGAQKLTGDFQQLLDNCGVEFDLSGLPGLQSVFESSHFSSFPTIDCSNVTNAMSLFANCNRLETIEKLIVHKNLSLHGAFTQCRELKNIVIEGEIGGSNLLFTHSSKLTNESIQSIIDALEDKTGATARTLTFHATVKAKLTEEQIATITAKNWTLA